MRANTRKWLKRVVVATLATTVLIGAYSRLSGEIGKGIVDSAKSLARNTAGYLTEDLTEGYKRLKAAYDSYIEEESIPAASIHEGIEIPQGPRGSQVAKRNGFSLSYNGEYEQPDWVAYVLTREQLDMPSVGRQEDFREDDGIIGESAHLDDYRGSGYSRGHLCPSADRAWDEGVNSETFLLSNMSPQDQRFNAGLWLKAEDAVRDAARLYGTLYIATGPVFSDDMPRIGECGVAVPEEFYKVLLAFDVNGGAVAIGMICPQEYEDGTLRNYLCPVDEVEIATGIDFFHMLPDDIEEEAESTYNERLWPISFQGRR